MPKFRRINQGPTGKDWMKYRPYEQFSSYDGDYLKLVKKAYQYLSHPKQGFQLLFEREMLIDMAVILGSYVEDSINEIGLWKAFQRKNKELYGYALPFYDLEDYDPDYLNPQDFAYLIWYHLGKMAHKTLDPYGEPILEVANHLYDLFEEQIDELPSTDFYEQWLDLSADTFYFDLKMILDWMAFENYLLGPEFIPALQERIEEFFEDKPELMQKVEPEMMIYGMKEDFLFTKNTSCCGLTAAEWLAEVARCSEEVRTDVRNMTQRLPGMFLYEGHDEDSYHFSFVHTKRKFAICRESMDLELSQMTAGEELAVFNIVPWQGKWWLSGTYMAWGKKDKDLDKMRVDPQFQNFHGWSEDQQEKIREITQEMEEAFLSYFGKRLVFFPDEKALTKAMGDHNSWWNKHKTKSLPSDRKESKYIKLFQERSTGFEDLNLGSGSLAAFYVPGEGISMSSLIPEVIDLLQQKSLSTEQSHQLFYSFFYELDPSLAHYIAEHYAMGNLCHPMISGYAFVEMHFDFFLRYYNPSAFGEVVPMMSLLPEE
ncbi:MAG: DUF3843 family protein [Bacteroidota bacterium]